MTEVSLHGPVFNHGAVQPQFAAAGEQPQQADQNQPPPRQGTSCPNLRVACADGSTFIPKGTDLDALFGNNGPE